MLRSMVTLARWLGPWADATQSPELPTRDEHVDHVRVRIYEPPSNFAARAQITPHRAPILVAAGLHYAGPDDVRMDRFCRILAGAGHLVIAPFIPSYLALIPDRAAIDDFQRVFDARNRWTNAKPVAFSISFGSLLVFALAATHAAELDGVVCFGGYADFQSTMKFCLTGAVDSGRKATRDPLNQPVVLMNLLPHLHPPCPDPAALSAHWRRYVESTWGRPEMKLDNRFAEVARALEADVPEALRELFHIGIGSRPGAEALAFDALTRFPGDMLDPMKYLPHVRGRVDLVHGADDDVIPFEHSHQLAKLLTNADVRVHITGLYGHTGAQKPKPRDLARELVTMLRVLRVFAR